MNPYRLTVNGISSGSRHQAAGPLEPRKRISNFHLAFRLHKRFTHHTSAQTGTPPVGHGAGRATGAVTYTGQISGLGNNGTFQAESEGLFGGFAPEIRVPKGDGV
jgi:hypothetical protein